MKNIASTERTLTTQNPPSNPKQPSTLLNHCLLCVSLTRSLQRKSSVTKCAAWLTGKAPGSGCIYVEIINCAKPVLLTKLHERLCRCWEEDTMPQDMSDAIIITLYKNKGDCNNYRGVSLLSIVGKTFARVILNRLQKLAERVHPEAQCDFRRARSTIYMLLLFSLRQLQEKCRKQQVPTLLSSI